MIFDVGLDFCLNRGLNGPGPLELEIGHINTLDIDVDFGTLLLAVSGNRATGAR